MKKKGDEMGTEIARDGGAAIVELKTLFRVVNEEIEGVHETFGADRPQFLCECGQDECEARIAMSIDEYESVRAVPTRFAVAPGHDLPRYDRVVESNARYAVVETRAEEAVRISIARDPRRGSRARGRSGASRIGLVPSAA
jgi:hypothetical protein